MQLVACTKLSLHINRGGVEDRRLEAKTKDTKKIQGQGQEQPYRGQTLSRPRTGMLETKNQGHKRKCSQKKSFKKIFQVISKKKNKKRSSEKIFRRSPEKTVLQKLFEVLHILSTAQKIVLSSSRGHGNFRRLEASRPRAWPSRPKPSTLKCVLEDIFEAKDVLEDSSSAY